MFVSKVPLPLTTRPMTPGDLEAISALGIASKASWGYDREHMRIFADELTFSEANLSELSVAEVALLGDDIVGYFTIRQHPDGQIELDHLFIADGFFRRGIGTQLIRRAIALARDMGAKKLKLISDPNSAGFYEKHGAIKIGDHQSRIPGRTIPIYEITTE